MGNPDGRGMEYYMHLSCVIAARKEVIPGAQKVLRWWRRTSDRRSFCARKDEGWELVKEREDVGKQRIYCSGRERGAGQLQHSGKGGGCRVGEARAGTTSPMPDHKGFKLQ